MVFGVEIVKGNWHCVQQMGFLPGGHHDIPQDIADEVIESIRRFNEATKPRDTLSCLMAPNPPPLKNIQRRAGFVQVTFGAHVGLNLTHLTQHGVVLNGHVFYCQLLIRLVLMPNRDSLDIPNTR
ncbi:hypothetical protein CUMW_207910 [Citrus unshiu]|uniref:Uncharacterized protein n=1 Tax=Citrus unshiu TaxID=55188 RepID=A0A2H5Q974_CITUN|nr:hypothetical protein CUMW_207910 [Citrus unshiu]